MISWIYFEIFENSDYDKRRIFNAKKKGMQVLAVFFFWEGGGGASFGYVLVRNEFSFPSLRLILVHMSRGRGLNTTI